MVSVSLRGGRRRAHILALAGATLAMVGIVAVTAALLAQEPAPPTPPSQTDQAAGVPRSPGASSPDVSEPTSQPTKKGQVPPAAEVSLPRSEPIRVTIPKARVSSTLESLDLDDHGAMTVPVDPERAGWFTPAPTPGVAGTAVIAGHVTWNRKPAVFFRLGDLRPHDRIEVDRADGFTAVFTIDRIGRFPKAAFPTDEVYRNNGHPALRLITCGGVYDAATHRYSDNLIVWAQMTSHHRTSR